MCDASCQINTLYGQYVEFMNAKEVLACMQNCVTNTVLERVNALTNQMKVTKPSMK
jgi:hypothetical protein